MFLGSVSKTVPTARKGIEVGRNELDSKSSCPGDRARGFESHPFRQSCPGDRARGFESHPFRHTSVAIGLSMSLDVESPFSFQELTYDRRCYRLLFVARCQEKLIHVQAHIGKKR